MMIGPRKAAEETQRDLTKLEDRAILEQMRFFHLYEPALLSSALRSFSARRPELDSVLVRAELFGHIERLAEIYAAARLLGKIRVRREAGLPPSRSLGSTMEFAETLKGIGVRNAVEHIRGLRVVTPEEWKRLTDAQRARAFSASGIEERAALEGLKKLLIEGIEKDWTEREFEEQARALLGKFQQEAGALRTLWNTSVGQALARGREEELNDPEVKRVVSWRLFDAILDFATRPNHRVLDGGLAPADWPGWMRYAPLLGWNCRCTLVGVTSSWARKLLDGGRPYFDLTQGVPALAGPDPGFARAA